MRLPVWLAVAAAMAVAATSHARSFRQTYGATVPVEGGGCVWNLKQDYFVPRHCDSCRYDLFSVCKRGRTTSPTCRHRHPVYSCYCTPFGACRYRWRDHVYKTYCGCTPLRCYHGPWRLDKCRKHCFVLRHRHKCGGCETCADGYCVAPMCGQVEVGCNVEGGGATCAQPMVLANVESMEVETLGSIAALPRAAGGAGAGGSALPGPLPNVPTLPGLPAPGGGPLSFPTSSGPMALPQDSTY